jgi:hypothetical protein
MTLQNHECMFFFENKHSNSISNSNFEVRDVPHQRLLFDFVFYVGAPILHSSTRKGDGRRGAGPNHSVWNHDRIFGGDFAGDGVRV